MLSISPINLKDNSRNNESSNKNLSFKALPTKMRGMYYIQQQDHFYVLSSLIKKPLINNIYNEEDVIISKGKFSVEKIKSLAKDIKTRIDKTSSSLSKYDKKEQLGQCIHDAYDYSLMSPTSLTIKPATKINSESLINSLKNLFNNNTKTQFIVDADGKDYIVPMELFSPKMREILLYEFDHNSKRCKEFGNVDQKRISVVHNYIIGKDGYEVNLVKQEDGTKGLQIFKDDCDLY